MATEAEIQAAITKAAGDLGLSGDALTMLKAIRAAESGNSTDTGLKTDIKDKTGKAASSAAGMWQIIGSTWKSARSQLPAALQAQVPTEFTADPYAQSLIAAQLIKGYVQAGYGKDARLLYVAHWSPEVANNTKKKMNSGMDFDAAFSAGLEEAVTTGKLGKQGRFKSLSTTEKKEIGVKEVGGGLARMKKAGYDVKGLSDFANMTGKRTDATDGSGGGITYKGAGTGDDIVIGGVIPLSSGPSADRFEPDVVILDGLNVAGWHQNRTGKQDKEILVGNPKLVALPSRGTFTIWTNERRPSPLTSRLGVGADGSVIKTPVEVRLNVSLKNLSVRSKHVINKKPTRTGFHLTFWGMEPDILTGQGSTGVFLNQFGLASVMSISSGTGVAEGLASKVKAQYTNNVKIDVIVREAGFTRIDKEHPAEKLVTSDMKESKRGFFTNLVTSNVSNLFGLGSNFAGDIDKDNVYSSDIAAWSDRKSRYGSGSLLGSFFPSVSNSAQSKFRSKYKIDARLKKLMAEDYDPFRVAAQDAFLELLQVFKNNGQIRFHSDKYTGELSQEGPQEWSEQTGFSAAQGIARNNDVFARGVVLFRVKGTTYMGYFKSINFMMSAETPYTWDFDFTFQVVKTIKAGYVPETLFKKGVG